MHNTMKKTITVCSLLTLLSVCQWGWAEPPHFNLIGSFAEGDQWSTTNVIPVSEEEMNNMLNVF